MCWRGVDARAEGHRHDPGPGGPALPARLPAPRRARPAGRSPTIVPGDGMRRSARPAPPASAPDDEWWRIRRPGRWYGGGSARVRAYHRPRRWVVADRPGDPHTIAPGDEWWRIRRGCGSGHRVTRHPPGRPGHPRAPALPGRPAGPPRGLWQPAVVPFRRSILPATGRSRGLPYNPIRVWRRPDPLRPPSVGARSTHDPRLTRKRYTWPSRPPPG